MVIAPSDVAKRLLKDSQPCKISSETVYVVPGSDAETYVEALSS